ncbi:hypothetical protein GGTG_04172 [Gaeumannomyces tritici R3-111a-1]|uniref:Uncharacterized protein n=1 Tax=Gaeumannomyces tritici (strain R3-111a-1) TaxID=644352 RepID=J3NSC6_GAET3|nr:hypothetical protein GGTG_04172 [Gaeumannomyces tritici R3-111a-1]EJT79083.1 hypothetical protein GGTG_04172 [Gaeumannomyces tritici R3-111a-1]
MRTRLGWDWMRWEFSGQLAVLDSSSMAPLRADKAQAPGKFMAWRHYGSQKWLSLSH